MEVSKIIKHIFVFVSVVFLQLFVFDRTEIFRIYYIPVFLFYIITLPGNANRSGTLFKAFLLGVIMDYCYGTSGAYTIALLAVGFIRPYTLKLLLNNDQLASNLNTTSANIGVVPFAAYCFSMILLFNTLLFFTESIHFVSWKAITEKILLNSVFALFFIYICQIPFLKRY